MTRHIHIHVHDAFEESEHPRGKGGKFSSGGGQKFGQHTVGSPAWNNYVANIQAMKPSSRSARENAILERDVEHRRQTGEPEAGRRGRNWEDPAVRRAEGVSLSERWGKA